MRVFLFLLGVLTSGIPLLGQTQIGTGTDVSANTLYAPMYRWSATSTTKFARSNILYEASELASAGISSGSLITAIAFNKTNTGGTNSNPYDYKVYMANTSSTAPLSTSTTWASILSSHSLVYSNSAQVVPTTSGWVTITLQTPFIYTGGSIEIAFEGEFQGTSPYTTDNIAWEYTDGKDGYVIGVTASTASSNPATLSGTVSSYKERPNIRITHASATGTDGGLLGLNLPNLTTICPGSNTLETYLANLGGNDITGATIGWSVNGVAQTAATSTKTLTTGGIDTVALGSYNFTAGVNYDIEVYITGLTSSGTDNNQTNDTVEFKNFQSSLSGNYTINKNIATGGSNFASFNDLNTALAAKGICGNVTIDVATGTGPYFERVVFEEIIGADASNTLTINGNGEQLIDTATVSAERAVMLFDGADHITIDSLNVLAAGTYGFGVQFTDDANYNTFRNGSVTVDTNSSSSSYAGIVFSNSLTSAISSGNNGHYNTIENNVIVGGYYGISIHGSSSSNPGIGNVIRDNRVEDFYYYGIRSYYQDSISIIDNEVSRPNRSTVTTTYGLYNYYTENSEISYNWIHSAFAQATSSTSTFYGIYASTSDADPGKEVVVYNNIVSDINHQGDVYGIYNSGSDGWEYYHNTVAIYDPFSGSANETYGFYQTTSASDLIFKNNLVSVEKGGTGDQYAIYLNTAGTTIDADFNGYHVANAGIDLNKHLGGYNSVNFDDLASWQTANSNAYDANSQSGDPVFADIANQDYHPGAGFFNDIGTDLLAIVPDDFEGTARTTTPDVGALEFTPPPGPDMIVNAIYPSDKASCSATNQIAVELLNIGTDTALTLTLNWKINGAAQTPVPVSTVMAPGEADTITLGTVTGITAFTDYLVEVTIVSVGPGAESSITNNTADVTLRQGLSGTVTINATATPGNTVFNSFGTLANLLNTYGICGNLTVNVAPGSGPYNEQVIFNEIIGTSATAGITINGNGNTLTFTSASSTERGTLMLIGTDYLTVDSLDIVAGGSNSGEYGYAVQLFNSADHNTFTSNTITATQSSTSSNFGGIIVSGSLTSATTDGPSGSYNHFEGNTISGGYYGVTLTGDDTGVDTTKGNVFINNTIADFHFYGLYAYYQRNLTVDGNDISRANRTSFSTFYGIRSLENDGIINANRIHNSADGDPSSTSINYGMYFSGDPYKGNLLVTNNMIHNLNGAGSIYGVYASGTDNLHLINNSIIIDETSATTTSSFTYTRGIYTTLAASNIIVKNNIVSVDRDPSFGNHIVYWNTASADITLDNNVYFTSEPSDVNLGYYSSTDYTDMPSWIAATLQDSNSVSTNPFFTDPANDDFTPRASLADGLAESLASVTEDINGTTRGANPDPGAIEFNGAPCTGLSGLNLVNVTPTSGTVVWNNGTDAVDIVWGPVGFLQASLTGDTVSVSIGDTSGVISGLGSNQCYEYYVIQNCTSPIPGAPPVMGPYSLCTPCPGTLSGTYTIGGAAGPANFATFDSVATTLNDCGISGPVIFNIQAGTYVDNLHLMSVSGVSAVNTITFNGTGLDTLVYNGQGPQAAVLIDGTKKVTLNGMTIVNNASSEAWGVLVTNHSDSVTIDGCTILMDSTSTSTDRSAVLISDDYANDLGEDAFVDYLTIKNSKLSGGYYNINLEGNGGGTDPANYGHGHIIENNIIRSFYIAGIYTDDCMDMVVRGNTVESSQGTGTDGLYLLDGVRTVVEGNSVNVTDYGLYLNDENDGWQVSSPSSVINNMVISTGDYGIYLLDVEKVNVFHNTVMGEPGVYLNDQDTVDIRNNVFASTADYAFESVDSILPIEVINYNLYYRADAGNAMRVNSNDYANLSAFVAAYPALNSNSVEGDPLFVSSTDLHLLGTLANDAGDNSVGVLVDIDGETRPASGSTVVDMGADEYSPATCFPPDSIHRISKTATSIELGWNTGGASDWNIEYGPTGFSPGSGTMVNAGTNPFIVTNLSDSTCYDFYVRDSCGAGDVSIWVGPFQSCTDWDCGVVTTPVISGDTTLCQADSATLISTGATTTLWFDKDGLVYFNGNTLRTDSVKADSTFYFRGAEPGGPQNTHVGPLTNISSNAIGNTNYVEGILFTVHNPMSLDSVLLKSSDSLSGNINIYIDDNLHPTTDVVATINAAERIHQIRYDVYGAGDHQVPVGVVLQPGRYFINLSYFGGYPGTMFRATSGANFPYEISNLVTLTSNLSANAPYVYTRYYYLFDWVVSGLCVGSEDSVKVTIDPGMPPVASFTSNISAVTATNATADFDASASTGAIATYSWDFGDGNTGTGVSPQHVYTANGTYTVRLVVSTNCYTDTITSQVVVQGINLEENLLSSTLEVYPNPVSDNLFIDVKVEDARELTLQLMDATGRMVIQKEYDNLNGALSTDLELSELADGVYILRLSTGDMNTTRRVIKE